MQNFVLKQLRIPFLERKAPPKQADFKDIPDLTSLWKSIRAEYFPAQPELDFYEVRWSARRQKRTLGSCNLTHRRVLIASELQYAEFHCWLFPLLYHEMCHAALGIEPGRSAGGKRQWHGRKFKQLVARMDATTALDRWVAEGGWSKAVRLARSRSAYLKRIQVKRVLFF